MTHSIDLAGCFHRKTLGIFRCCHITCAMDRGIQIRTQLVPAGNDNHTFSRTEGQTGQTVASAVDIDDFAGLGNGIGTADIHIGMIGILKRGGFGGFPVPEDGILLTEDLVKTQLIHRK